MAKTKRRAHHRTTPGPHYTEGARKIWIRLRELGMTAAEFEVKHKMGRGAMFRYMHGDRGPDRTRAVFFERELGIDPADFDRKPLGKFELPKKAA